MEPDRELVVSTRPVIGDQMVRYVNPGLSVDIPPARDTWGEEVVASYDAFWEDISAKAVRGIDLAVVVRYFDILELISRLYEELMAEPNWTIETSNGTRQAHPHLSIIARLTTTSLRIANEIGATPMSRMKLGLTKLEGQNALLELERRLMSQGVKDGLISAADADVIEKAYDEATHEF